MREGCDPESISRAPYRKPSSDSNPSRWTPDRMQTHIDALREDFRGPPLRLQ